jgi:hypothetical protein
MAKRQRKFNAKIGENLMKYFVFIIAILAFLNGCSSGGNSTINGANVTVANSNSVNANSVAATNSIPSEMKPYNGVQNLNPNAFNASSDNLKVIEVKPSKDQNPVGSRIAPDDSTITSGSRGKDFFEARTFNSNPVLAKVEKIMDGKTTKYKVYLKNGKVLDAPADKMNNYVALSPQDILDIVGQLPKPVTNLQSNTEQKKDQKQQ